jgi:competence protein ComEA
MTIAMIRKVRASALALLLLLGLGLSPASVFAADAGPLTGVVNVNTATADQLMLLPGVGESKAKAILDYRKQNGGFKKVDDLLEVKGIGSAALERIRPFVAVQGKTSLSEQ